MYHLKKQASNYLSAALVLVILGITPPLRSQILHPKIWAGPMVGYPHPTETIIWLETTQEAEVRVEYWPETDTADKRISASFFARPDNGFIVKVLLENIPPGSKYHYHLVLDGERVRLPFACTFYTPPGRPTAPDTIRIAGGSCKLALGNIHSDSRTRRRRALPIFRHIAQRRPHVMLWLGDNVYMRKGDHGDSSRVFGRWHYERAFPSLRPLLASAHNLAILDDHDFGPNDCTGDYCYKNLNVQAHIAFWANRQFGLDTLAGTMGYEQYGDVDFFLTDNRFHRRPHTDSAACQFGKSQLNWLLNALAASSASFKFVLIGNQTLNSARTERISMNGNFVNLYPQEWREMIEGIRERQVQNVIFVTGDRHIAEVAVLDTAGYPVMYDFTFSPLSSPGMKGFFRREGNTRRVPGSYYGHKSFGVLEITGPAGNRQLRGQIVNRRGKTVFEILIPQRPTARN